ncbi:MAG: hypothetical protein JXM74_05575 [Fusobacteriaceae bacterium]|nr:hypothetical protein [Fusobacteriaceae bacterium]MBN2838208.1 hypothetical protein [Fusobacteriaceae bacterium]
MLNVLIYQIDKLLKAKATSLKFLSHCLEVDFSESNFSMKMMNNSIKNGFLSFVWNDKELYIGYSTNESFFAYEHKEIIKNIHERDFFYKNFLKELSLVFFKNNFISIYHDKNINIDSIKVLQKIFSLKEINNLSSKLQINIKNKFKERNYEN